MSKGRSTLSPGSLRACSQCKLMTYCSTVCQREHWFRHHKNVCKVLAGQEEDTRKVHGLESCSTCGENEDGPDLWKARNSLAMPCTLRTQQAAVKLSCLEMFGRNIKRLKCTNSFSCSIDEDLAANPDLNKIGINPPIANKDERYPTSPRAIHEGMSHLFTLFEALVAKHPEETCRVIHSIHRLQNIFIRIQAHCWYLDLSGVTDAHMRVTFFYNSNCFDIYKKP